MRTIVRILTEKSERLPDRDHMLDYGASAKCMDHGAQPQNRLASSIFLLLTLSVSVLLLAARIHDGFHPSDDPVLAHSAERVLHGERPHVNFHDGYTGGLAYLDALSFRMFGTNLLSPRIMLLLFFVPGVAAIWYIASRMLHPAAASIVTLLTVVWSVPLYPSPVGSWYLLYFAIFATAALFRYIETLNRGWILAAGGFAGIAILFKITGIYIVAAGLLFLLFDEQSELPSDARRRLSAFPVFVTGLLLLFCGMLILLVRNHAGAPEYYHFVLPGIVLSALLIYREWQSRSVPDLGRVLAIATRLLPFLFGVCIPITAFLVPYVAGGYVRPFLQDVLLGSLSRVNGTSLFCAPVGPVAALLSLPIFVLMGLDATLRNRIGRRIIMAGSCVACGLAIWLSVKLPYFAYSIWLSAASSIPLLCLVAVVLLLRTNCGREKTSRLLLLVAVTSMCSLNQFPVSLPIYFSYVGPLLILSMAALVAMGPHPRPSTFAPIALFFLAFGAALLIKNQIYGNGLTLRPEGFALDPGPAKAFALPRARGIRGPAEIVDLYQRVCEEIAAHGSGPLYAGPDSSALYFLSGRENATPILWEFAAGDDARPERILADIERGRVSVVVVNHSTHVPSGPMPSELLSALQSRFPESKTIENFEIRWR